MYLVRILTVKLILVARKSLAITTATVKLYRNKTVIYSARLWAVLGCQMEFQWYPMDVQGCLFEIESCKLLFTVLEI